MSTSTPGVHITKGPAPISIERAKGRIERLKYSIAKKGNKPERISALQSELDILQSLLSEAIGD